MSTPTGHMLAPGVPCYGCQICLVSDCEKCAVGETCAEHDPTEAELAATAEMPTVPPGEYRAGIRREGQPGERDPLVDEPLR